MTTEYRTWSHIRQRCSNPKDARYHDYGGRGIAVCERWDKSFQAFLDDMGKRPIGLTLERIDNDGNYEPKNCKWATYSEQALNKRTYKNNKSGYRGVDFHKATGKWQARLARNHKEFYLGVFDTPEEAYQARLAALES